MPHVSVLNIFRKIKKHFIIVFGKIAFSATNEILNTTEHVLRLHKTILYFMDVRIEHFDKLLL